jgi:cellulose synthase/poly-beta-1,6-N-acetylglucosamine synthase-like glycosyltransferase
MLFKYFIVHLAIFFGILTSVFLLLTMIEHRKRLKNPETPKKFPFVSIIIPFYNEEESMANSLISLAELNYPKDRYEIILVDDGSTDKSLEIARKMAKIQMQKQKVSIKVFTKKNGGKGSAVNFGISKSKGEIIGSMDADSFATKESLTKMIGYFSKPDVTAVTASLKIYKPKGIIKRIQHIEYLFGIAMRKIFSFINVIAITPGPLSLYRKEFFDKYGGFDEHNPTEDTEMGFRIQSNHYRVENCIDAVIYTIPPATFGELLKQRMRWYHGYLKNLRDYPQLFNPKYGYLAMFAMPASLISVGLLMIVVIYFTYLFISKWITTILNWNAISFDLLTAMKDFKFEYLYYELTSPVTILLLISLILNLSLVLIGKIGSRDKEPFRLSYAIYMASYAYLYSFWWIMMLLNKIFGGTVKWKTKKYE